MNSTKVTAVVPHYARAYNTLGAQTATSVNAGIYARVNSGQIPILMGGGRRLRLWLLQAAFRDAANTAKLQIQQMLLYASLCDANQALISGAPIMSMPVDDSHTGQLLTSLSYVIQGSLPYVDFLMTDFPTIYNRQGFMVWGEIDVLNTDGVTAHSVTPSLTSVLYEINPPGSDNE